MFDRSCGVAELIVFEQALLTVGQLRGDGLETS
jgi:hypothetical protein